MFRRAAPTLAALAKRALAADLPAGMTGTATAGRWLPALATSALTVNAPPSFGAPRFASSTPASPPSPAAKNHTGWGQTKASELLDFKGNERGTWLWCSKTDLVIDAVKKMAKANVGSLLVFDPATMGVEGPLPADAVVGIVTERDYLTKVAVTGRASTALTVGEIMTAQSRLLTAAPDASVVEVMTTMVANNIRHVPVVSGGTFLGMLSMRDVVATVLDEHNEEVGRLQDYIQGGY